MSVPLAALRRQIVENLKGGKPLDHQISYDAEFLKVDKQKFPRKIDTNYRSKKGTGPFYQLDAVWFVLLKEDLKLSEYIQECTKNGIQKVSLSDKKALVSYMKGETEESQFIDTSGGVVAEEYGVADADVEVADTSAEKVMSVKPLDQWTIEDIFAQESLMSTRQSVLCGKQELKELLTVYTDIQQALKGKTKPTGSSTHDSQGKKRKSDGKPMSSEKPAKTLKPERGPEGNIPIIIVPAAVTSVLTMYNAQDFLSKGIYTSSDDKRAADPTKPAKVIIERPSYHDKTKNAKYHIIDDVKLLKKEDWPRVVAMFATGAKWQFAGWPWKTPAEVFHNIRAFHLYWEDEPLNKNVAAWRVHVMPLSKLKRYEDRSKVMAFWQMVEHFIAANNKDRHLYF